MLKKKIVKNFHNKKAYTLIELSIAILVISLLMAGVFSMATGSISGSKSILATQRMNEIYKSLGTFLMVNKRLPCPASVGLSKVSDASYGQEVRAFTGGVATGCGGASTGVYNSSSSSNLSFGAVPIKSLNLSSEYSEDGYDNKIGYIIDQRFTLNFIEPGISTGNSFGTVDVDNPTFPAVITIKEKNTTLDSALGQKFIFVLISYGANGNGAFRANDGGQNATTSNSPADTSGEYENQAVSSDFDGVFINNSFGSDIFDDVIMFKTRQDFIVDFRANNFSYCPAFAVGDSGFVATNLYYNQYLYASNSCPGDQTKIKIKRCTNISGEWKDAMSTCPANT